MPPPTHGDAELAALSQRETPLPDVSRDEDFAHMLQEDANLWQETTANEDGARRMVENMNRVDGALQHFGRMTIAE